MLRLHGTAATSLLILALLSLSLAGAPAAAQQPPGPEPHVTVYRIHVHDDGNATWTVELRQRLPTEQDRRGFQSFLEAVESGNVTVFEGIEGEMRPLVADAENATGRSMRAVDFGRDAAIRDTVTGTEGVTSVSFNWTGFARREDGELVIGDVFVGSGLTIAEGERLVVEHDPSMTVADIVPAPDAAESGRLQWNGRRFFEANRPRVVFRDGGTLLGEVPLIGVPFSSLLAALVVLLSGFFGGLYIGRRVGLIDGDDVAGDADGSGEELLTDEDRIVRLLEERDGRMKQAEIVESTGWSKSKVSMVLSDMEDEDVISKLRLGRENVIDLED